MPATEIVETNANVIPSRVHFDAMTVYEKLSVLYNARIRDVYASVGGQLSGQHRRIDLLGTVIDGHNKSFVYTGNHIDSNTRHLEHLIARLQAEIRDNEHRFKEHYDLRQIKLDRTAAQLVRRLLEIIAYQSYGKLKDKWTRYPNRREYNCKRRLRISRTRHGF